MSAPRPVAGRWHGQCRAPRDLGRRWPCSADPKSRCDPGMPWSGDSESTAPPANAACTCSTVISTTSTEVARLSPIASVMRSPALSCFSEAVLPACTSWAVDDAGAGWLVQALEGHALSIRSQRSWAWRVGCLAHQSQMRCKARSETPSSDESPPGNQDCPSKSRILSSLARTASGLSLVTLGSGRSAFHPSLPHHGSAWRHSVSKLHSARVVRHPSLLIEQDRRSHVASTNNQKKDAVVLLLLDLQAVAVRVFDDLIPEPKVLEAVVV